MYKRQDLSHAFAIQFGDTPLEAPSNPEVGNMFAEAHRARDRGEVDEISSQEPLNGPTPLDNQDSGSESCSSKEDEPRSNEDLNHAFATQFGDTPMEAPSNPEVGNMFTEAQRARDREEAEDILRLWNGASSSGTPAGTSAAINSDHKDKINLDGSKVESIKTAMAQFSLPDTSIPPWAKRMSDVEWADMVKKKLVVSAPQSGPCLKKS